jgi:hypothetical protein
MGVRATPWVALVSPIENFLGIYQGKSKETQRKETVGVGNGEAKQKDGRIKKMMPGVWIGTGEGREKKKEKEKEKENKRETGRRREGRERERTSFLSPLICIQHPN